MEYIALKNFLETYYHQDTWEDFGTNLEVWDNALKLQTNDHLLKLKNEIDGLLKQNVDEILKYFKDVDPESLHMETGEEYKLWLSEFSDYLRRKISTNTN